MQHAVVCLSGILEDDASLRVEMLEYMCFGIGVWQSVKPWRSKAAE